ncbi:MAG TPA: hypothetical protein VGL28_09865 [Steroidobacteraceae bacterium]
MSGASQQQRAPAAEIQAMRRWWLAPLVFVLAAPAYADDYSPPPPLPIPSPITDHFSIRGGFFWGQTHTYARFDSATGVQGTPFTGEGDLGLTNQARAPNVEIIFRIEQRSRLRVNFLDSRRAADRVIDHTLQYGDQTFLINSPVHSVFDWRQMDLTYTYSFLRNERFELGGGLGVHLIQAEASAEIPNTPQFVDYNTAGPFATLALDGTWRIDPHWSLNTRGQYMRVTISSISGALGQYHADLQYRWKRNLAFGIGYQRQDADVTIRRHDPSGELRFRLDGPEAFARVSF